MESPRTTNIMNLEKDTCQIKAASETSAKVYNMNSEGETKNIDSPGTSLDNSTCNTPIYSSNLDLDAPLSPVLSTSKHSMKYIARKNSRNKLMHKFSQSSVASQLNLGSPNKSTELISRTESNSPVTIVTDISNENLASIASENTQLNSSINSNKSSVLERMKKIKELQQKTNIFYKLGTIAPNSSPVLPVINKTNTHNLPTKSVELDLNFKVPKSPIVSNATNCGETNDNFTYEITEKCPVVIPFTAGNIGFQTGAGKKIQLSERALKRSAKIFDDITELPSTLVDSKSNNVQCDDIINISAEMNTSNMTAQQTDLQYSEKSIYFKTANGKMIPLSEKTMCKVKSMFDDISELSLYEEKPEHSNQTETDKIPVTTVESVNKKVIEECSPDSNNITFTQANDSQMCWVADNAECMMDFMSNQWHSISSKTQENSDHSLSTDISVQPKILKNEQDFQSNLSQEMDLLLGNLTILDRFSSCSNKEKMSSDSQLSECRNNDKAECSHSQETCFGFTSEENLQSLKIVELYKRAIKYIDEDLKKDVLYPISFIFDDVQCSLEYKNKNLRYSLRSRNKPCVTYVGNKRKSTRVKQKQEVIKRRKSSYSDKDTKDVRKKSSENNSESSAKSICQGVSSRTRKKTSIRKSEAKDNKEENNTNDLIDNLQCISSVFDISSSEISTKSSEESDLNSQICAKFNVIIATSKSSINFSDTSNEKVILGFSDSGKKVKIPEDSLLKVKQMLDDHEQNTSNDTANSNGNIGFSTASGEKVNIFEEALKKTQCNEDNDLNEKLMKSYTSHLNNNPAFATASGKFINVSKETFKKVANIFNDLDLPIDEKCYESETPKQSSSFGFSTASGKKVNISKEALKKTKHDIDLPNAEKSRKLGPSIESSKMNLNCGFATASGKKVTVKEEFLTKVKNQFDGCDTLADENLSSNATSINNLNMGFSTAAGKKLEVSEDALKKSKNIFDDFDFVGKTEVHGELKIEFAEESLKKTKHPFEDCDINEGVVEILTTAKMDMNCGFTTAAGKAVDISEVSLRKAKSVFQDCDLESTENSYQSTISKSDLSAFATATCKNVKISDESLKKNQNIFDGCDQNVNLENLTDEAETNVKSSTRCKSLHISPYTSPVIPARKSESSPQITCNESTPVLRKKGLGSLSIKKRSLGVSSCRQINISNKNLKRAKLVFDEMSTPKEKVKTNINNNFIPKFVSPASSISTPAIIRNVPPSDSTPQIQNVPNVQIKQSTQLQNSKKSTVPIRRPLDDNLFCNEDLSSSSQLTFREDTEGDVKEWKINLEKERDMMKLKVAVIETRMQMLDKQVEMIYNQGQMSGHLFKKKTDGNKRISLQEIVNNRRPGKHNYQKCLAMGLNPTLLDIDPEYAAKLHFHVPWYPNTGRTYPAVIHTEDNAVVVPNSQNYIGIREIETAFRAMPGVVPDLIGKGWIANHYKWIVWKLASMERNYPDVFKDYLAVDNVVSQLKYRYDRELDRVQRPALRKIFECDDTPAKRMILCVSSIIKLTEGKYDLELTDGWYSIRTTIDGPLNSLVDRSVIKIGGKLMIQGAELSNCDGCGPLEAPANVRLQIHYNSTRRAAWFGRLGYQSNLGPLCISLRTINGNGGPVGLTCAYIARVYPVSFMERLDEALVWRNRKAEQHRANQWESMQAQVMERLHVKVQQELEQEWQKKRRVNKRRKVSSKAIQGLCCPRTLYEIYEESNDRDSIIEMMTDDQRASLQKYQSKLSMEQQADLNSRLDEKLAIDNIKQRNVSSVLKLLLLDVNSPYHSRVLSIWRPKDSHLQDLKEGTVVRIYNLSPRNNGSLSSIPRTEFNLDLEFDTEKFEKFERNAIAISQSRKPEFKPLYGEFDTVGMIIFIDIQQTNQSLWLADEDFRFLVIQIREGTETCCLFDGLTVGKITAVTNLQHQKSSKSYGEALAKHYTTISSYPQQSYLQDFMKEFIENLPQEADKYLQECKDQVEIFLAQRILNSNTFIMDCDTEQDNIDLKTNASSVVGQTHQRCDGLTLSDEEMSLFDTQLL